MLELKLATLLFVFCLFPLVLIIVSLFLVTCTIFSISYLFIYSAFEFISSYTFHFGGSVYYSIHIWLITEWKCSRLVMSDCNPMNCSPPGFSVHGVPQTRMLEWIAILFRGSSQPREWTHVSHTADKFFTVWVTREACYYRVLVSVFYHLRWNLKTFFPFRLIYFP